MLSFIIQPTSREMKNTNLTEMQVDKTRNLNRFIYYFAFKTNLVGPISPWPLGSDTPEDNASNFESTKLVEYHKVENA